MSKKETPLTRDYWKNIGGILIEEFEAVTGSPSEGRRMIDGIVLTDGPCRLVEESKHDIAGRDVVVIQTKAHGLGTRQGMPLLGQALFSRLLVERWSPRSVRSVAVCTKGDGVLERLAKEHDIEVVVNCGEPKQGRQAAQATGTHPQVKRMLRSEVMSDATTGRAIRTIDDLCDRNVVLRQKPMSKKTKRIGMYLLGDAIFGRDLLEEFGAKTVRSIAVCRKGDAILEPLAERYGIEIEITGDRARYG